MQFERSTEAELEGCVKVKEAISHAKENIKNIQYLYDNAGLTMARPDSFLPHTDIYEDEQYVIMMDVPGLTTDDIVISR